MSHEFEVAANKSHRTKHWFVTLLRWAVLMLLHMLCISLAIAATLGLAVVA